MLLFFFSCPKYRFVRLCLIDFWCVKFNELSLCSRHFSKELGSCFLLTHWMFLLSVVVATTHLWYRACKVGICLLCSNGIYSSRPQLYYGSVLIGYCSRPSKCKLCTACQTIKSQTVGKILHCMVLTNGTKLQKFSMLIGKSGEKISTLVWPWRVIYLAIALL